MTTLSEPVISSSPVGLTIARALINVLDVEKTFNNATGITAFLTFDEDVAGVLGAVSGKDRKLQENMLFNHVSSSSLADIRIV